METFVDDRPIGRAWKLESTLREQGGLVRRRRCMSCERVRRCVRLELLRMPERWFCVSSCWRYELGVLHGKRWAYRELTESLGLLVDELPLND